MFRTNYFINSNDRKLHNSIYMRLVNLLLLVLCALVISCNNNAQHDDISWDYKNIDLGKFDYPSKVQMKYVFKNISGHSIMIKKILPGCDCTIIDGFTSSKIDNKKSGEIKISYDSKKGIIGPFRKNLFVFFEGTKDSVATLYYTGIVTGNK